MTARLQHELGLAINRAERASKTLDNLPTGSEKRSEIEGQYREALDEAERLKERIEHGAAVQRARTQHTPDPLDNKELREMGASTESRGGLPWEVREPDMYEANSREPFYRDLYLAQLRNDPAAMGRIQAHHAYELSRMSEERAVATGSLGGIVPPQYLVDLYAKASRNGRVFADQVNHQPLPDEGMSLIVPRITTSSAAGAQSSESSALSTQDVAETDLTVNVRTIGGYIPVSRQTLERAAYSEPILFEDLLARYWAAVDTGCLTSDGTSGTLTGVFHTSGVLALSANSDGTLATLWAKLASAQEQILAKWGGLGLKPDKVFMHPRRWSQITNYLDTTGRPIFGYDNHVGPSYNVNPAGTGHQDYGYVGRIAGLDAYVDSNMPVNLDTNSNRDAIIVTCSNVVHLWEREEDPVTLAFEQQAGTSLQVQLIAYGYAAFTAGRYPDATAIIDDFPAPTF